MKMIATKQKGYSALLSVIIVGALILAISVTLAGSTISGLQSSFAESRKEIVIGGVEACAEDTLIKLSRNNSLPASVTIPGGLTCTVSLVSQLGNVWVFTVTGTINTYTKTIRIQATRTGNVAVNSWREI